MKDKKEVQTSVVLLRVDMPTPDGKVFNAAALEAMVKEDPENLFLDEEGNLCSKQVVDAETAEYRSLCAGSTVADLLGDCALSNFQQVLKFREKRGQKTTKREPWITVSLEEEAEK